MEVLITPQSSLKREKLPISLQFQKLRKNQAMEGLELLILEHAAQCLGLISVSFGSSVRHDSRAKEQRLLNLQPLEGLVGDGVSSGSIDSNLPKDTPGSSEGIAETKACV